jgi:hypothetical protein
MMLGSCFNCFVNLSDKRKSKGWIEEIKKFNLKGWTEMSICERRHLRSECNQLCKRGVTFKLYIKTKRNKIKVKKVKYLSGIT